MMVRSLGSRRLRENFRGLLLGIGSIGIRIGRMFFVRNSDYMLSCCFRILMQDFLVRKSGRLISLVVKFLKLRQPLWKKSFSPPRRLRRLTLLKRILKNLYLKFKANGFIILVSTGRSIMTFNKIYHIKW